MGQPAYEPVEPVPARAPVATPVRRTWSWRGVAIRIVLALAGAAGMIVRLFMNWVRSRGFAPFAIYRIALGIVLIILLMRGSI